MDFVCVVAHAYNPNICKAEAAGRSGTQGQGHPRLLIRGKKRPSGIRPDSRLYVVASLTKGMQVGVWMPVWYGKYLVGGKAAILFSARSISTPQGETVTGMLVSIAEGGGHGDQEPTTTLGCQRSREFPRKPRDFRAGSQRAGPVCL